MANLRYYTKRNLKRGFFSRFFSGLSVTGWIIVFNVLFFIASAILLLYNQDYSKYIALQSSYVFEGKYLWTFFTSMFMHAGFFHLFVNMFVLFSLGGFCEKIIGGKRFFWFYIISGLVAGLFFVILAGLFGNTEWGIRIFGSPFVAAVGASGAIFAIAGLFMILTPNLKFMIIFLPFFSLPASIMIPLVLFGVWILSAIFNWPVGNTAHFGGFIVGVLYGLYLKNKYPRKVRMLNQHIR